MKVLIVNTSELTGGAAIASNRLMKALRHIGVDAKMLVRDKQTSDENVISLPRYSSKWNFYLERLYIFLHLKFKREHLFEIDTATLGNDITRLPEFKEADVIHLEWVNQGMLSLRNIQKIIKSSKKVVWTMHDLWPASGICHLSLNCENFKKGCHNCRLLPNNGATEDLSTKIWNRKKQLLKNGKITFVACSKWLANQGKSSDLFSNSNVTTIPNPIDTNVFHKKDKTQARQNLGICSNKKIITFVARRVTDELKGTAYLIEALNKMIKDKPSIKEELAVALLGSGGDEFSKILPLEVFPIGYVSETEKIINVYSASDLFVLPSLSENLPNTIMEAMTCGVPCVGFNVGGIPEMIDHKESGYVAEYKNADDLAKGIYWTLYEADHKQLSSHAIEKVKREYSMENVARKYLELYKSK